MTTSRGRNVAMRVLSVFGMILSAYAVYVEHKVTEQRTNPHSLSEGEAPFVALCDLGGWASCSDVLTSPSSRLFGPSNASLGVLFYAIIMLYPSVTFVPFREELLMAATAFSCSLTIYLGSILYGMGDFCILCVSTYVINWSLLVVAVRELRAKRAQRRTATTAARRAAGSKALPASSGPSRAVRVLGVLGALAAVWVALMLGVGDAPRILGLSPAAMQVVTTLPLWLLVSFGAYSLASIGFSLCTFRDCPEAFVELEKDIAASRVRLQQKGFGDAQ